MSNNLENRVNKIVERMGDPDNALARAEAIVRSMSVEELAAELRGVMLAKGYDVRLPHDEALAAYIEKVEAGIVTKTPEEQEVARQLVVLVRSQPDLTARLFPKAGPITT